MDTDSTKQRYLFIELDGSSTLRSLPNVTGVPRVRVTTTGLTLIEEGDTGKYTDEAPLLVHVDGKLYQVQRGFTTNAELLIVYRQRREQPTQKGV